MTEMKLTEFEPDKIMEREKRKSEDQEIMDLLGRFTAQMLMDALRSEGGHPKPEWGNGDTWRFYYIDECRRRGIRLLEQLGWATDENSEYVNLHTGCIRSLLNVATNDGYFSDRHTIANKVWSIIEDWEPFDPSKPNKYLINYLQNELSRLRKIESKGKNKLDSYQKSDIKKIPEYEKRIIKEQQKGDPNPNIQKKIQ